MVEPGRKEDVLFVAGGGESLEMTLPPTLDDPADHQGMFGQRLKGE